MEEPETRYAKSGDVHVAYQVFGEGPIDLVFIPGFVSHIEHFWDLPEAAALFRRLATFSRVIHFDKRGTGLSDRLGLHEAPTLEERMDDLRAVLDAVGSERAAILGFWEGGPMSLLFAATYPERTSALILSAVPVAFVPKDDYPWTAGPPSDSDEGVQALRQFQMRWGHADLLERLAPDHANDPRIRRWQGKLERYGASPGAALALMRMNADIDVRHVLPAVRVPTLVLHRRDDRMMPVEASRYVVERIPGARLVTLEGSAHLPFLGDRESLAGEVEEFLTGTRAAPEIDRVLATILFTDVVASTERARELGDRRWTETLGELHARIRREVERFRGRVADFAGDGALATFDGPARAVRCAQAIHASAVELGLDLRSGLHTGECEVTRTGVAGIAVHVGARVAGEAGAGEILASRTVRDLVAGSGLVFEPRGQRTLKGVAEPQDLYAVTG